MVEKPEIENSIKFSQFSKEDIIEVISVLLYDFISTDINEETSLNILSILIFSYSLNSIEFVPILSNLCAFEYFTIFPLIYISKLDNLLNSFPKILVSVLSELISYMQYIFPTVIFSSEGLSEEFLVNKIIRTITRIIAAIAIDTNIINFFQERPVFLRPKLLELISLIKASLLSSIYS